MLNQTFSDSVRGHDAGVLVRAEPGVGAEPGGDQ